MRQFQIHILLLIFVVVGPLSARAEPINQEAKQSVGYIFRLEAKQPTPDSPEPSVEAKYLGTCFAGNYDFGDGVRQFLVTARHVVVNEVGNPLPDIFAQFPAADGQETVIMPLNPKLWLFHPDPERVDAAIFPGLPIESSVRRIQSDLWLTPDKIAPHKISEGDEAFYVGLLPHYPGPSKYKKFGTVEITSLVSKMTPVTRFARLSYVSEAALIEGKSLVLLDANNTPGHSGSPVFLWATPTRAMNELVLGQRIFGLFGLVSNVLEYGKALRFSKAKEAPMDYRGSGVTGIVPVVLIREILETPTAQLAFEKPKK